MYTLSFFIVYLLSLPEISDRNERIKNIIESEIVRLSLLANENEYVCSYIENKKKESYVIIDGDVYFKNYWQYEKDSTGYDNYIYSEKGYISNKICKIDGKNCLDSSGQFINLYSECYSANRQSFGENYKIIQHE